jgi:histidinol-phosphate/aromatic aminotransferase/cobyric acid decarboxylase-like protein/choline kinase
MKAIILAAGYGRRMRPLTNNIHKTLLTIGGKTIIEQIVSGLKENGISEIIIVTGYRENELREYLIAKFNNIFFKFIFNKDYSTTNNIYSLSLAFDQIEFDKDVILIESDLIYDKNVINRIITSGYKNVALVDNYQTGMDGTVVKLDKENKIREIIPSHLQGVDFDFSNTYKTLNIYKFSKDFCKDTFKRLLTYYSNVIDNNCYYELILGILVYMQKETIYAEVIGGEKWSEVDDPNDLAVSEFIFNVDKQFDILNDTLGGYWNYDIIDFRFIRNMYFPDDSIIAELKTNISKLLHNYGSKQTQLNKKLSYFLQCDADYITLLNGASQAYPVFKDFFKGSQVLIPDPTFGEYPRIFGEKNTYPALDAADVESIERKGKLCNVIVFVNPNNPSGTVIDPLAIYRYAKDNSDKMVIVDESFIAFSEYDSILEMLQKEPLGNIIVLTSLSKVLGVPGIRLGYTYSTNESFNNYLKSHIPIWNINSIAENYLEIILKHQRSLQESYDKTKNDRAEFIELLEKQDFVEKVYPSGANFIMVKFTDNLPGELFENFYLERKLLSEHKIYIYNASSKIKQHGVYFRFAVRLPVENKLLINQLKILCSSKSSCD